MIKYRSLNEEYDPQTSNIATLMGKYLILIFNWYLLLILNLFIRAKSRRRFNILFTFACC